jgi:cytochrome b subunit of formate dehydrogenase
MTVLFAVTGFALWADEFVGAKAAEASRTAHAWLTAAAGVFVAVHLLETGVTHLLTRVRAAIPYSPHIHTEGG